MKGSSVISFPDMRFLLDLWELSNNIDSTIVCVIKEKT